MKIYLKFIPVFLLLIGCVANQEAQENINNKNNPSQANAEVKKDNKICRQVSVSGSRLKKKVCYTSEEEAMAKKSQRILREQQNRERGRSIPDNQG